MNTNNALVRGVALATIAVSTMLIAATNLIKGTAGPDNLVGTPGDDTINGLGGVDTMTGLAGNDIYVVDDEADKVVEQAGGGTDTVRVFGWYALPAYIEKLKVAGSGDGGGKGNSRANRMIGNSASNTLDGGPANDTLTGGGGADDFIFSSPLNAGPNVDRVTDFNVAEDSIQLWYSAFWELSWVLCGTDTLPSSIFHIGTDITTVINYNPISGALYYKFGPTLVRFATLAPNLALKAGNFRYVIPTYLCL